MATTDDDGPGPSNGRVDYGRGIAQRRTPTGRSPATSLDRPGRPRLDGWAGAPTEPTVAQSDGPRRRSRLTWLLLITLAVVGVLGPAVGVVVTVLGDEAPDELGRVRSAGGARVRTSDGAAPRALEDGEAVLNGWAVEAGGDGTGVEIDLAAGGVLRVDGGATLTFTEASDSDESGPRVDIAGGRTWFNPAGAPESAPLVLRTEVISLTSIRQPVALDCTNDCTVEAPGGGVKVSAEDGVTMAPATDEALTVTSDGGLVMRTVDQPSAWVLQNLEADGAALPPSEPTPGDGVIAGAVPATAYTFDLAITSDGEGDALPSATFLRGQAAHYQATVDTESCPQVPCDVRVAATSERINTTLRLAGSFHIQNRSMGLTLNRPIDCPGPAPARAAGTVTITVDMSVSEAAYDRTSQEWIATVMGGSGTAVAEVTDASCLGPPNTRGTRTNTLEMTGQAAG